MGAVEAAGTGAGVQAHPTVTRGRAVSNTGGVTLFIPVNRTPERACERSDPTALL